VGGVVGTFLSGRLAVTLTPRAMLLQAGLSVALPAMLLGVTSTFPVLLLLAAQLGAGSILVEVATDTSLQTSLHPDVLARAYGIAFPAAIAGIVVGSLVAAPLVVAFGVQGALVAIGVAMTAYVLLMAYAGRDVRTPGVVPNMG
jgi:predicted MFS family arabinose efflux permease